MSLTLVGCFSGWNKTDKALYAGFVGLNAIDTYQTFDILDDPNKRELNPLIKSKESLILIKLVSLGAIYLFVDMSPKYRTEILGACAGVIGTTVLWNTTID